MNKTTLLKNYSWLIAIGILLLMMGMITRDPYVMHIFISLLINIILAASLWLIFISGEMSLAHISMMAIGAYTSAVLVMKAGFSFWLAMPMSGLMSAIISLIIGYPALRLKGFAFFMVTFAFAEILIIILSNFWQDVLGGHTGLFGIKVPSSIIIGNLGIAFNTKIAQYYLGLFVTVLSLLFIYAAANSRFGKISRAIAQADSLAESVGINTLGHKMTAFAIGGFSAGIAGSLNAHFYSVIAPGDFSISYMILIAASVIVGGATNIYGPIIGASLFSLLPVILSGLGHLEVLITGVILILSMRFLPGGLISLPTEIRLHLRRRKARLACIEKDENI